MDRRQVVRLRVSARVVQGLSDRVPASLPFVTGPTTSASEARTTFGPLPPCARMPWQLPAGRQRRALARRGEVLGDAARAFATEQPC